MRNRERKLSASQIITLGFAGLILLGSVLLMLPAATKSGISASFADALFTATSAVCVTGLVVQDTATYWSGFGQGVILALIQIGGMGVVTVAVAISYISGKKITLRQRSTLQEAISAPKVGGIVRLTGFIVKMTLCFELVGAAVMAPVRPQTLPADRSVPIRTIQPSIPRAMGRYSAVILIRLPSVPMVRKLGCL